MNVQARSNLFFFLITCSVVTISSKFEQNGQFRCRTEIKSSCQNDYVSKWNRKNVSNELKKWIRSISVEWNADRFTTDNGRLCKFFTMIPNYFFHKFAPDATSPDVMMIGKIKPPSMTSHNQKPKTIGPIWADMHNGHEWNIKQTPGKHLSAHISSEALFGNGSYYGILNNDQLRLGTTIKFF